MRPTHLHCRAVLTLIVAPHGDGPSFCDHLFDVLPGNVPEGVRRRELRQQLLALTLGQGIDAVPQFLARLVTFAASLGQADLGIRAQGYTLVLAGKAILEPPELRPARSDLNVQTALVSLLVDPVRWLQRANLK